MRINQDALILSIVAKTVEDCEQNGTNWADCVDDRLEENGIELHDDRPDGRNHEIIARLADGREVYHETDGSGGLAITNMVFTYDFEIDDIQIRTFRARNISEAVRTAKNWLLHNKNPIAQLPEFPNHNAKMWVGGRDGVHYWEHISAN